MALDENEPAKHLVVYFDAMGDMDKLEDLASKLNALMSEKNVGSGNGKKPIDIHLLLDRLIGYGVHFALSPHAMKQGKRGIDYDWHAMPADERDNENEEVSRPVLLLLGVQAVRVRSRMPSNSSSR